MNDCPWYPEIIVLGPGGMKGFLELGFLIKLFSIGFLKKVDTYVGCSVGSLISLLLVAGFSPTEIVTDAVDTDFFKDITEIRLVDIKDNTGLISNHRIKDKLSARLEEKFGIVPTLNQLYLATGLKYVSVSYNLTHQRVEYLDYETEPHLSAVDAALLSMNIPFLFYKLKYRACTYIDGAFGNPYPIDICDNGQVDILGISISSQSVLIDEDNPLIYLYRIIHSSMSEIKARIIKNCSTRCKHVELKSTTIDLTGLSYRNTEKSQMLIHGYNEASKFIDNLSHPLSVTDDIDETPFCIDENPDQMTGALESVTIESSADAWLVGPSSDNVIYLPMTDKNRETLKRFSNSQ